MRITLFGAGGGYIPSASSKEWVCGTSRHSLYLSRDYSLKSTSRQPDV